MQLPSRMRLSAICLSAAPLLFGAMLLSGCGTISSISNDLGITSPNPASVFVIGTDAPLASVVSFNATIQSVNAMTANGTSVPLISGTPTIDFARFNGLQTLLDVNDVAPGTYNQVSVTFASATIGYLDIQSGSAPTIKTMNATFTNPTVTVTLANPLVVSTSGPVGIRLDFRLDKSIQVDSTGQITGQVTPTFNITTVGRGDADAHIDEFIAGVASVGTASSQSFVIQGPHGRQFTVKVNANTEWENSETFNDLTNTSIVQISGTLDKATSTIDADEVAILSQNGFYASGQVTYVTPASGAANAFQFYVRGTLPANGTAVTDGAIDQVKLSGNEKFGIYWMHNRFTEFLFNASSLLPGQHVSVGGSISGAQDAQALSVNRVVLRNWGFNGTVVANSVNQSNGSFQMQVKGFAGLLIPQTVTVYTQAGTTFRDGMSSLADVNSATTVRVVGLLIKDPISGQSVILGRFVDDLK